MAEYDKIGHHYKISRHADQRIFNNLIRLAGVAKNDRMLDIGAGTGNYTNEFAAFGCTVDAIEPSQLMIAQAEKHSNVSWFNNSIENIVLPKNYYDGAICTLSIHHFNDLKKAVSKIYSTLKHNKNFVIFGADPRQIDDSCWLKAYFGSLINNSVDAYVEVSELIMLLESTFKNKVKYRPFPIPFDISDGFFYAGWQEPEKYLDENFRNNISVFNKASDKSLNQSIEKLSTDLKSGIWNKKYKKVRNLKVYNGGYYFLKVTK